MSEHAPPLWEKMRRLADSGHARADELRERADKLEEAGRGFYAEPQMVHVKSFIGAWARARRVWSECSGEDLV